MMGKPIFPDQHIIVSLVYPGLRLSGSTVFMAPIG